MTYKLQSDKHKYSLFLRWRMFTVIFCRDGVKWEWYGKAIKKSADLYTQ
jgi:hypothetical protein